MLAVTDLVGLGALITATAAAIVSIIVALQQKPIAAKVEEVHTAVATGNAHTLGELADAQEARHPESPAPPGMDPTP